MAVSLLILLWDNILHEVVFPAIRLISVLRETNHLQESLTLTGNDRFFVNTGINYTEQELRVRDLIIFLELNE